MSFSIRPALRLAVLLAIVATAFLITPARADAAACSVRTQSLLAMPDGKTYAVLLNSDQKRTEDVALTLYSTDWTYRVTLKAVALTQKMPDHPYPMLRSLARFTAAPAFVALPRNDNLIAVRADPIEAGCAPTYAYTPELDLYRYGARFVPSPGSAAEGRAILASFTKTTPVATAVVNAANPALTCAEPYAIARTVRMMAANYPPELRDAGETGVVIVAVDLAPSGAVEGTNVVSSTAVRELAQEASVAAKASTYSPELFRCQPVASTYMFRVGFLKPK
jgi:TonB family protein